MKHPNVLQFYLNYFNCLFELYLNLPVDSAALFLETKVE